MRIDPVFLLAPEPEKPKPPSVSRRAFFLTALGCLAVGGSVGFGMGSRNRASSVEQPDVPNDALAWALQLQEGDLRELVRQRSAFLILFASEDDPRLLDGVERLAMAVLEDDPAASDCRAWLAASLADEIEAQPWAEPLARLVQPLRRVR